MKCAICGATCRCKNARGGICCGCHRHKAPGFDARAHDDARRAYDEQTAADRDQGWEGLWEAENDLPYYRRDRDAENDLYYRRDRDGAS
jgi:hypothetical protein